MARGTSSVSFLHNSYEDCLLGLEQMGRVIAIATEPRYLTGRDG